MKKIYALLFTVMLFSVASLNAQITVTGSTGLNATYTSFTKAGGLFAALNGGPAQTGNTITVSITADVATEDGVNSLNAGVWSAINITPSGAKTISGAVAGVLLNLNGADNVNINGLNSGGNSLVIENTSAAATATTIRYIADAINNNVQNCTIKGSGTSPASGTIVLSTGTTSGNDNILITGNTITSSGTTNLPYNAIYSSGTSATVDNSAVTVSNNNINDYFGAATSSNGIYVAANSSTWTITGNRFYQTATRTATTGTQMRAILIVTASGSGYTVSNNIIGYGSSTATGVTTYAGAVTNRFAGIEITAANTPVSSIQGNTIAAISINSSSAGSQASPVFCGINLQSGGYNVGTTTGNTIGSITGTGSIVVTGTTTGFYVTGINATSTGTVTISNNNVGSVTAAGAAAIGCLFYGIWTSGTAGSYTINSNIIGNTTTNSNSIQVGTNLTGTATSTNQNFYGIRNDATGTIVIGASGAGNSVRNIALRSNSTAAMYGIYNALATSSLSIGYNTITDFALGWSDGTTGSGVFAGLYVLGTTTGSLTFTNNNVQNLSNLRTTGSCYGIYNSNSTATVNVTNNTINNLTRANAASGTLYCYYNASSPTGVHTFSNNTFTNLTCGTAAGTSSFYGIYNLTSSSSTWNIFGNTISNNIAGSGTSYCIYDGYGGPASTCYNNTISNITTAGTLYGVYLGGSLTSTVGCYSNTISNLTTSGAASTLYGIYTAAITPSIYKNKLYTLTTSGATGIAYGIYSGGGTTLTIYNNLIGDIQASASTLTAPAPSVVGMYLSSGTTINAYYNTIYLNAASTGTNFGTAGVYMSATPTTITLRNNIFDNTSTANGTGKTIAIQRAATALTNYAVASNNNLYYAGIPVSATKLIFYDGTNSDQTLSAFKSRVTTREIASVSENPPFLSTTGSNANFLHIDPFVGTQVESGAVSVTGITDDYDAQPRFGETGYTGTGTAPDIGADEFNGIAADATAPLITFTDLANTSSTSNRTFSGVTIADASGVNVTPGTAPRVYYKRSTDANIFNDNTSATDGWKWVESTGTSPFSFTIDYSKLNGGSGVSAGQIIQYFAVAQDQAPGVNVGISYLSTFAAIPSSVDLTSTAFPIGGTIKSYTILQSISGVISVPGTYTSLTNTGGLFEFINANEVTGNITISVTGNLTGETGANALNQFASPYTVTIKPAASTTPSITGSFAGALIKLNGADRVTIDGSNTLNGTTRDLTISNTSTSASAVINVASLGIAGTGANDVTIKNTNIIGGSGTTAGIFGIVSSASTGLTVVAVDNDNLTIKNNSVSGVYRAISCLTTATANLGLDNLVISGNSIGSNTLSNYVTFRGIEISYANSPVIDKNTIFNMKTTAAIYPAAIDLGAGVVNGSVTKNILTGLNSTNASGYGPYGINFSSGTGTTGTVVANNMISDVLGSNYSTTSTTFNACGIRVAGGINIKLYFNTINLSGNVTAGTAAGMSADIIVTTASVTGLEIQNNILVNKQSFGVAGSLAYNVYLGATGIVLGVSNSNDYSGAASTNTAYNVGFDGTSPVSTLTNWRTTTGSDAASIAVTPIFTSATDLHLQSVTGNGALNNKGTSIGSVTTDIDDEARNSFPDMGADEFTPPLGLDVGISALARPTATSCHSATENVIVTLSNYSGTALNLAIYNVTVTANVTGQVTAGPFTVVLNNGILQPGQTLDVTVGQINTTVNGTYSFNSTATVAGDADNTNNTDVTSVVINYVPLSVSLSASQPAICQSGSSTITATPAGGVPPYNYAWNTGASTASISTGTITASNTYSVTVTASCGATANSSVNIVVNNPLITGTTPGVRCGPGTVILGASPSTGSTVNWYAAATGGSVLSTSNTFTTPSISSTTNFYVSASKGGLSGLSIPGDGDWQHVTTAGGFQTSLITSAYMILTVLQPLTLSSIDIYPSAALGSSFTMEARTGSASGTAYTSYTGTTTVVNTTTPTVAQTVPVNWVLPAGTYYIGFTTSPNVWRSGTATHTFPWTLTGVASMDFYLTPSYQYYFYNLKLATGCESSRTAVTATVTNPVAITTNVSNPVVCAGGSSTLSVSSANAGYTYTWSPGSFAGATYNVTPASTSTYTVLANDGVCTNTADVIVTVQPNPTISSTVGAICISGTTQLSANPATGYGANTLQWQTSMDNINFTDISGETNATYTTPTLTATTYYKLLVKNSAGAICSQPTRTQVVNNPQVVSTIPDTRCGIGTLQLQATASAGAVLNWYAAATGGTSLQTGQTYTTPVINTTTNYYVGATFGGSGSTNVGMTAPTGTSGGVGKTTYGLYFNALTEFTLASVKVHPIHATAGTAGTVTIGVIDAAGTILNQATANVVGNPGGSTVAQTVNLNFTIPAGNGYRLVLIDFTGITSMAYVTATIPYPYTVPGVVSITSATYTGSVQSGLYYYFYDWSVTTGCEGPRTLVAATITTPPAITASTTQSVICPGSSTTLNVSSPNDPNYNYLWSPGGAGANLSVTPGATTTYTVTATDPGTSCVNTAQVLVNVQPNATNINSNVTAVCVSGAATLTVNPSTGYSANTLQWQNSTDNVTFTNITGQTGTTYTTPVITTTTYYKLLVKDGVGAICSQPVKTMTVNNPLVTGTTPAGRCGPGTVTLGASPSSGASINWYAAATGGAPLATSNSFTTPSINATTTYYAAATSGGFTGSVGKTTLESTASGTGGGLTTYMIFDALSSFTLQTVVLYPYGATDNVAGTVTIELRNSSGTALMSQTVSVIGHSTFATSVPQTVTLNFPVTAGTNYRLGVSAWTGGVSNLWRDATGTYPYTLPGIASITGPSTAPYYYFFYNWGVSTGCESARSAVIATINPPPAITSSLSQDNICPNASTTLGVTSPNSNYTYTWTPGSLSGATQMVNPSTTTSYTVTANDAGTGCQNFATITVNVQPIPVLSSSSDICVSGTATLSATPATGYATGTLQWQISTDNVSFTDISGATGSTYTTPTLTATRYYKLLVKNGAGTICSQPTITQVVNNPLITGSLGAARCGPGNVTLSATPSTGASIKWYAAASGGNAIATGNNYTPFITSTTTYYAAATSGGGASGTLGPVSPVSQGGVISSSNVDWDMQFNVTGTAVLTSVKIYPITSGQSGTININNSSNVVLFSIPYTTTVSGGTTAQIVPMNITLNTGTGYKMRQGTAISLNRNTSGQTYPVTGGPITVTGNGFDQTYWYYFYEWTFTTGCESNRTPVTASISPAPAITTSITRNNTCPGATTNLQVTSSNPGYVYTWTPGNLVGSFVTVSPMTTTKYRVTANQASTGCQNIDSVTINVQPAAILNSTNLNVCSGSAATLTATPSLLTAYAANSIQWQSSPNNSSWTNITGATNTSYTTPALTGRMYYRMQVKNATGGVCSQPSAVVNVSNPQISGTIPASRCGPGTVTLSATAGSSTLSWYAASTGGSLLAQGASYTTASIIANTTYYVAASTQSSAQTLGVSPTATTCGTIANSAASDYPIRFATTKSVLIVSAYVIPNATGTFTFALRAAASSTNLQTVAYTFTAGQVGVAQKIMLNFVVSAAGNYQLTSTAANLSRIGTFTCSYPYTNTSGSFSIVGSATSSTTAWTSNNTNTYNVFFDVEVADYCESARTPVLASISTPVTPAVSIAITSGTNPNCAGALVTFTATPTNGGATPSYQWKKDGVNVGTNSNKYTDAGTVSGSITVVMTSSGCVTTPTATSNAIGLTVQSNQWKGGGTTNFSQASNWCSGVAPTATTDAVIPAGATPYPIVGVASAVRNVTIGTGAYIDLSLSSLTVNGTLSGTGQFKGTLSSTLTLAGTGAIGTLYADPSGLGTVTMSAPGSSLTLGNALNIMGGLNVGSSTLATGGLLTIKSDIKGTGWVGPVATATSITGAVTVERYIPHNAFRAWRLLSDPVMGAQTFKQAWQENQAPMANGVPGYGTLLTSTGGGNGYDAATAGNSLLQWNGTALVPVSATNNMMQTVNGYFVYIRGDRSSSLSGSVFNPSATTLRTNGTLYQGTQGAITVGAGANVLVGNVYAAPVDFANLTRPGVNAFKKWDPKLQGSSNLGAYQTFSSANGYNPIPGGGSYGSTPNSRIESGEAFFVSSSSGGSIQFTEAAKTTGSKNVFRTAAAVQQFKTNLYANTSAGSQLADGNLLVLDDAYTSGNDDGDVVKLNNMGENIGITSHGQNLVIEGRKKLTAEDVLQYSISNLKQQQYSLEFMPQNIGSGVTGAYLEDNFDGSRTPVSLTGSTTVRFTVTGDAASSAAGRFRIVFKGNGTSVPVTSIRIKAYQKGSNVQVDWKVMQEQSISRYEVEHSTDGSTFTKAGTVQAASNGTAELNYSLEDARPVTGDNYYRVKSIGNGGEYKYTETAMVTIGKGNNGFHIYPNPVTDSRVNVEFINQSAGSYTVRLINKEGRAVYTTVLSHGNGSNTESLRLPSSLPAGSYQVEILSSDKENHAMQSLIISNK